MKNNFLLDKMMDDKNMLCTALSVIAVLLGVVSIAIPHWYNIKTTTITPGIPMPVQTKAHAGLWKACIDGKCKDLNLDDTDMPLKKNVLEALRGLTIAGVSLTFLGIATYILMPEKMTMHRVLFVLGGLLSLAASILFMAELKKDMSEKDPVMGEMSMTTKISVASQLTVLSGVLSIGIGLLH